MSLWLPAVNSRTVSMPVLGRHMAVAMPMPKIMIPLKGKQDILALSRSTHSYSWTIDCEPHLPFETSD